MSKLKIAFQSIGVFLLVCYVAVAGFIWRVGNEPMRYRDVKIIICDSLEAQFIEASDLQAALRPDSINPIGQIIDSYDTYKLEKKIGRNPLVRKVHCYHTPDSLLRIDIYQRHPILRIKSNTDLQCTAGPVQRDCYLDTEGELMRYKYSRRPIQVPLATGFINNEMAQGALFELAQFLRDEKTWQNAFTQIYVEANGDIRLIPRIGDHTVLLGSADDLEQKFDHLELFYKKVLEKKGWNSYKTINLKFKGQVIAEKK